MNKVKTEIEQRVEELEKAVAWLAESMGREKTVDSIPKLLRKTFEGKSCPYCSNGTGGKTEEPGVLFAIIPDDQTHTMTLFPLEEGQTAIKLTKKTAEILIAMLDRQIQEWS